MRTSKLKEVADKAATKSRTPIVRPIVNETYQKIPHSVLAQVVDTINPVTFVKVAQRLHVQLPAELNVTENQIYNSLLENYVRSLTGKPVEYSSVCYDLWFDDDDEELCLRMRLTGAVTGPMVSGSTRVEILEAIIRDVLKSDVIVAFNRNVERFYVHAPGVYFECAKLHMALPEIHAVTADRAVALYFFMLDDFLRARNAEPDGHKIVIGDRVITPEMFEEIKAQHNGTV